MTYSIATLETLEALCLLLGYDDLKHAHTESVIPVTDEDYTKREHFNSTNDIEQHRNQQDITPLSANRLMLI